MKDGNNEANLADRRDWTKISKVMVGTREKFGN